MARTLIKGNEAIGEAAIRAGCRLFFGYPITPQTEILEYMSRRLPQVGGTFLQAESEVAASNMLYGAAGAGARVMTASSSPGISLMMEAVSYMAGAELPAVIVNVMRAGPGLGGILPGQADYLQATKGRRARGLPLPGPGPPFGPRGGRPDTRRLRSGRLLPEPGPRPLRRGDRPDHGAGRVWRGAAALPTARAEGLGHHGMVRGPAEGHHQLPLPGSRFASRPTTTICRPSTSG